MQITNKIPNKKKYILTADDHWVRNEMDRLKSDRIRKEEMPNFEPSAAVDEKNLVKQLKDGEFSIKKSYTSFRLSEVTSFTYGPVVSRFWMLRKHTILMDKADLEKDAPFYGWNCITLGINKKCDIYLIIKNELAMANFIKLLIYKMETIDGFRGSAIPFKDNLLNEKRQLLKGK